MFFSQMCTFEPFLHMKTLTWQSVPDWECNWCLICDFEILISSPVCVSVSRKFCLTLGGFLGTQVPDSQRAVMHQAQDMKRPANFKQNKKCSCARSLIHRCQSKFRDQLLHLRARVTHKACHVWKVWRPTCRLGRMKSGAEFRQYQNVGSQHRNPRLFRDLYRASLHVCFEEETSAFTQGWSRDWVFNYTANTQGCGPSPPTHNFPLELDWRSRGTHQVFTIILCS